MHAGDALRTAAEAGEVPRPRGLFSVTADRDDTDADLLRHSAEGDRAAFERLVARHAPALYRFIGRVCSNPRDAEDALQDGLLSAWRGAPTYRGASSVRTWLFQIVIHACRRLHRRRAGEPERTEPVEAATAIASADPGADDRAARRELGAALDAALGGMPQEAREVLLLRDVEGLSGEEVAAALGISLAAMKSRLHRARLELKRRVEHDLGHGVKEMLS